MEPKGYVLINKELKFTVLPSDNTVNENIEEEYREGLSGYLCLVMDVAVNDSGYLVLFKAKSGDVLWHVDKRDTKIFLPVIKKNGTIMPAGLNPIEEMEWMAKSKMWEG